MGESSPSHPFLFTRCWSSCFPGRVLERWQVEGMFCGQLPVGPAGPSTLAGFLDGGTSRLETRRRCWLAALSVTCGRGDPEGGVTSTYPGTGFPCGTEYRKYREKAGSKLANRADDTST